MGKFHLKSVHGMTGVQLNKVITFLTGEKSLTYRFDKDKNTFIFTVKKSLIPEGKEDVIKSFEDFFKVEVELL
jgi:ribosomal protein L23